MPSVSTFYSDDPFGLDDLVIEMNRCGQDAAKAEVEYRRQEALKTLELKASGMAVGIIDKVLRGDAKVSMALLDWRCKEAEYKAAVEALNVAKIKSRNMNEMARREYSA